MTARGRLLSGLVATVIALAGFVTVGAPTAAAGSSGTLQYAALGDSYAAGVGAGSYDGTKCMRSSKGYPALLDSEKHIRLQANATCAGATTSTVADTQLSTLNPGFELVTLTVGGNDLGFAALAVNCLPPTGTQEKCQEAIDAAKVKLATELPSALTLLYGDVADAAPKALIVVTGYPLLFELVEGDPLFDLKAQINGAITLLNSTIRQAVDDQPDSVNIIYVDVTTPFLGHGIGSTTSFINAPAPGQPPSQEDFHPNAAGYRAYADAISAALRKALDRQEQSA
jgi:lysophospholipase L1-like esterase